MRVSFFLEGGEREEQGGEQEEHILTVEDMEVPMVNDIVWMNILGRFKNETIQKLQGHKKFTVIRRDFSIIPVEHSTGLLVANAHAEILLHLES